MSRPGNVARKIQGRRRRDTKLIINGRPEGRTGEWHVARMPTPSVHRLPRSTPVFVTRGLRNFGLAIQARELGLGSRKIHLRGLHYMVIGRPKPNGTPYTNTDKDWMWLQSGA